MKKQEGTHTRYLVQVQGQHCQALAHPTRIAIVELLCDGELPVAVIIERLGLEPANIFQHFAALKAMNTIINRREGDQLFYLVCCLLLIEVLNVMRRCFWASIEDAASLSEERSQSEGEVISR